MAAAVSNAGGLGIITALTIAQGPDGLEVLVERTTTDGLQRTHADPEWIASRQADASTANIEAENGPRNWSRQCHRVAGLTQPWRTKAWAVGASAAVDDPALTRAVAWPATCEERPVGARDSDREEVHYRAVASRER